MMLNASSTRYPLLFHFLFFSFFVFIVNFFGLIVHRPVEIIE